MFLFKLRFSSDICLGVGLLEHVVALCLLFKGTTLLFSIVAPPIHIPTNSAGGLPFLHTLSSIYCCRFLLTDVRRYLIVVLICISLIIRTIVHLFICLLATCMSSLGKCLFRSSVHLSKRFFFILTCMNCLYIYWISTPNQSYHLRILFPIQ